MAETRRFKPYRGPGSGLTARLDVRAIRRELGLGNLFRPGVQKALFEAHQQAARRVQVMAAAELEERRTHRPRRENALRESILHPRNRNVSASMFEVGIEQWLFSECPAWRYARRIELGGPNPMNAIGPIRGAFFIPGGPHAPDVSQAGRHGQLRWSSALVSTTSATGRSGKAVRMKGGFTVKANDVAAQGYRMHRRAGEEFLAADRMYDIYHDQLRQHVPDWVRLRRA